MDDEFEALRREPDPLARGRRATQLLATYQQRSVELARVRRAAIEEARDQLGGSYTEVARAFGLTKGRIAQIRSSAPPVHRAFFGVGPLDVALAGRRIFARDDLVIASENDAVGAHLIGEAEALTFTTARLIIDPREEWEPAHDAIVVCGPASAHVGQLLMGNDPMLGMRIGDGALWSIVDKTTDGLHTSPMDDPERPRRADHAYLSRQVIGGHVVVHIAGLHALGSIGAAHYLTEHLPDLWSRHAAAPFSMAVTGEFNGLTPTSLSVLIPPQAWHS
ncbi:MAG: hypothetical protein ACRDRH_14880 [Pseudonocardia sp.]